jgi:DNA-binding transcriptional ArsR family regulator
LAVARKAPAGAATAADDLVGVLRTLADPTRLRLFLALRAKERCVSDLVASEGLPQPLVSHHLRILARAGLAQARRADGFTLYSVDAAGMAAARAAAMDLLDPEAIRPVAQPGGNPDCCR